MLVAPLSEVLYKYGGTIPPELALLGAVAMIAIPRVQALRARRAEKPAETKP